MTSYLIHYHRQAEVKSLKSLKNLLLEANKEVAQWEAPIGSKYKRAGGCAGTVIAIQDNKLHTFHAGDTKALLISSEYQSTNDHILLTTTHNSFDGGLTSFWGLGDGLVVDLGQFLFNEDDILFLATDGLLDVVTDDEIASKVRASNYFTHSECQALCKSFCNLARKRGSLDDISALVVYREE